jgi:hypothetical protein
MHLADFALGVLLLVKSSAFQNVEVHNINHHLFLKEVGRIHFFLLYPDYRKSAKGEVKEFVRVAKTKRNLEYC